MGGICCQSKRKGPILSAPFAAGFTRCPLIFVYFLFVCLFILTPCANTVKDLENWDNPPPLPRSFLHTILAVGGSLGEWIWSDLIWSDVLSCCRAPPWRLCWGHTWLGSWRLTTSNNLILIIRDDDNLWAFFSFPSWKDPIFMEQELSTKIGGSKFC